MSTATIHQLPTESFGVEGRELTLIPEGVYQVRYVSYATANMFGGGRLILRFQIETGKHKGVTLERFYPVKLLGKAGQKGNFSVTARSLFIRDFARATGNVPERFDRIPMTRLRGRLISARVKTVDKDFERDSIPKGLQYSKVCKLLSGEYAG